MLHSRPAARMRMLPWLPRNVKAMKRLIAAESMLTHPEIGPPESDPNNADSAKADEEFNDPIQDAREALSKSLAASPSGRAYAALGELEFLSNSYQASVIAYRKSLAAKPSCAYARAGLFWSLQAQHVQNVVERSITPKQNIHSSFAFTISGTRMYAYLVCEKQPQSPFDEDDNARITVYAVKDGGKVTIVWQSEVIPSIEQRCYFSADLWACRMTGSNNPELVFMGVCSGGSANPSLTYIFRWNGRTFREVLETDSPEQAMWISRLGKSGRRQVRCVELVGDDMSHSEQVRWPGVYDWNGTSFVESDSKYPGQFRETLGELEELHKSHQGDWQVTRYLAKAYLIEGRTREARRLFRKEVTEYWREISFNAGNCNAWWRLGEIAEWSGKWHAAKGYYRKSALSLRSMIRHSNDEGDQQDYARGIHILNDRIQYLSRNPLSTKGQLQH